MQTSGSLTPASRLMSLSVKDRNANNIFVAAGVAAARHPGNLTFYTPKRSHQEIDSGTLMTSTNAIQQHIDFPSSSTAIDMQRVGLMNLTVKESSNPFVWTGS